MVLKILQEVTPSLHKPRCHVQAIIPVFTQVQVGLGRLGHGEAMASPWDQGLRLEAPLSAYSATLFLAFAGVGSGIDCVSGALRVPQTGANWFAASGLGTLVGAYMTNMHKACALTAGLGYSKVRSWRPSG